MHPGSRRLPPLVQNLLLSAATVIVVGGAAEALCRLLERDRPAPPPVAEYITDWGGSEFATLKSAATGWLRKGGCSSKMVSASAWSPSAALVIGPGAGLARTHWANPCYGPSLIREREGFAPAVFADLTGDHLAGFRWLEQRAHSAAINAVWRVLIFSLLPRHFF